MKVFRTKRHQLPGRSDRGDDAASMAESARVFSRHRIFRSERPVPARILEAAAQDLLRACGQASVVEGIIPGHLKLLVKSGPAGLALSMTRIDTIDRTAFGGWEDLADSREYELTVNFHVMVPVSFDEATIMLGLDPEKLLSGR
jgi:hypothetical protein